MVNICLISLEICIMGTPLYCLVEIILMSTMSHCFHKEINKKITNAIVLKKNNNKKQ